MTCPRCGTSIPDLMAQTDENHFSDACTLPRAHEHAAARARATAAQLAPWFHASLA